MIRPRFAENVVLPLVAVGVFVLVSLGLWP